jgi:DNA repair ATPase RecN
MKRIVFKVLIERKESPRGGTLCGPTGLDAVSFLISPNPGEPLKALKAIASGGEISRVMLAIKTILAESDDVRCLVFDEIDTASGARSQSRSEPSFAGSGFQAGSLHHPSRIHRRPGRPAFPSRKKCR